MDRMNSPEVFGFNLSDIPVIVVILPVAIPRWLRQTLSRLTGRRRRAGGRAGGAYSATTRR